MDEIKKIILVSGKRKSGKDYLSEMLLKHLGNRAQIVRISAPIKAEWSKNLNLDFNAMLSDGPYKERYRRDMIVWSDEVRARDYGYFCRAAMTTANAEVIIVSDIRRKNDIRWFRESYGDVVHTLRLTSLPETRKARGWTHTLGVDDVPSECDLDDYAEFDLVMANDNQSSDQELLNTLLRAFKLS